MAINRRKINNPALRDAFLGSARGQHLVVEAKQRSRDVRDRKHQLEELVHDTFVDQVPRGYSRRPDVYRRAARRCYELARVGGKAFDDAIVSLKYTWTSKEAYDEAIKIVVS